MKPIETKWKGYRFRSRTEARWAVFLDAAELLFEYEPEGVILPSGPYLPDFRLSGFPIPDDAGPEAVWLEVKGGVPTDLEIQRCAELAQASGEVVLLAMGAPDFRQQILVFDHKLPPEICEVAGRVFGPFAFMTIGEGDDECVCVARRPDDEIPEFAAADGDPNTLADRLNVVGRVSGHLLGMTGGAGTPPEGGYQVGSRLRRAYDASRSARFEFGDADERWRK